MTKQLEFTMYYRETLPGLEPATQPSQLRNLDRVGLQSGDSMGHCRWSLWTCKRRKLLRSRCPSQRMVCTGVRMQAAPLLIQRLRCLPCPCCICAYHIVYDLLLCVPSPTCEVVVVHQTFQPPKLAGNLFPRERICALHSQWCPEAKRLPAWTA